MALLRSGSGLDVEMEKLAAPSTPPQHLPEDLKDTPPQRLQEDLEETPSPAPAPNGARRRLLRKTSSMGSSVSLDEVACKGLIHTTGLASLRTRILFKSTVPTSPAPRRQRLAAKCTSPPAYAHVDWQPGQGIDSDSSSSDSGSSCADSSDSDLSAEEEVDVEVEVEREEIQEEVPEPVVASPVRKQRVVAEKVDPLHSLGEDPWAAEAVAAAAGLAYQGDWTGAPAIGSVGFNSFAAAAMRQAGVASKPLQASVDPSVPCPPLQPHQEAALFLLHPRSPVSRLLVDHPTGSGKTREMIDFLNNFFEDPRPKVPIFPKEPVCRNFYAELLRWPSKYRDYFCCLRPGFALKASGVADWREKRCHFWNLANLSEEDIQGLIKETREVLEMKGCFFMGLMKESWQQDFEKRFPGEKLPAAPLRALRYTSAGGSHAALREDGLPFSALFKLGFSREDSNVYSNKVVVMDEAHNLVRSVTQYEVQLTRLRELLRGAKGTVLAGFTGTPILGHAQEGRQLLDIIKGSGELGDEGFISSFPMRPQPLFPQSMPRGLPDAVLTAKLRGQFVRKVLMTGEALQKYDLKRSKGLPDRRLRNYCNLCVHFGSLHEGRNSSRHRVLGNFEGCAPKLFAMAKDIAGDTSKALVLVNRSSGLKALLAHLQELNESSSEPFGVATMEELAAFNAPENLRGERYRVMVADASQCSEGVSFFAVRRVLLADVPAAPSGLVQSVGRAIRMYGHRGLEEEEKTVKTTLYVSELPKWMRSPLGAWAYRTQKKHLDAPEAESKARRLLRTLRRVGISSLDDLKARLDARVKTKARTDATEGVESRIQQAADAVGLLEAIGLWGEAKLVRDSARELGKRQSKRGAPASAKARVSKAAAKAPKEGEVEVAPVSAMSRHRHYLVRALHQLQVAESIEEAVEKLALSGFTADEIALKHLAALSKDIVPALAELRSQAIDREVLQGLAGATDFATAGKDESDGESSAHEFALSDGEGSGGEAGDTQRAGPLILPPGWEAARVKRGGRDCREFVSPTGLRFRTEAQVRPVIAAEWRTRNMALSLKSKYEERLKQRQAVLDSTDQEEPRAVEPQETEAAAAEQETQAMAAEPEEAAADRIAALKAAALSIAADGTKMDESEQAEESAAKRLESSEAVVPWQSHTGKNLGEFWGRSLSDYGFKGVVCALLGAA
eukprot:CAMPEP_0115106350 /NCGR_PEP_ID=MMETSP0227-20121206/36604_1 /TAXON_ID=89957 /ORGANISM="Polarella glacialis, Strain CCMP 1383" /LENGTH=1183 /DNA_ID=CAMNT_0002503933 /DNA_START=91 /DNA_END=3640 /DNA_ORIENTATION=-